MNRIFRISGAGLLAGASSLFLAPVSTPALGQVPQSITCQPSTVTVVPGGGSLSISCTSPGGTTPPPSCQVTVSPPTLSGAGTVTVTANNCGTISRWSGTSPTTAVSTANGQTPVPSSFTDNLPANSGTTAVSYTYTVVGDGGTNSAAVSISGTGGGGGGGGTTSCGAPTTLVWGSNTAGSYVRQMLTIAAGGTAMAQFTVGSSLLNAQPKVIVSNSGGTYRPTWALTSSPCTFPTTTDPVIGGPPASTTAYIWFLLSGTPSSYLPILTVGNTYYVNVQNGSRTTQNFFVDLYD